MSAIVFKVVELAFIAVAMFLFTKLIPMAKDYLGEKKLDSLRSWAEDCVLWANDLLKDGTGEEKRRVVTEAMKKIRDEQGLPITDEQIDILIRGAYQAVAKELELKLEEQMVLNGPIVHTGEDDLEEIKPVDE